MPAHILLVDDDIRFIELLKKSLQSQGLDCQTASNSKQMWLHLHRNHFDLIVLDIMMPEEDGLSLCQKIRQSHPEIGIIFLTGKSDVMDRVIGLEIGGDDYLVKPCHPRELVARIHAFLRRQKKTAAIDSIQFGDNRLDKKRRRLINSRGEHGLTSAEFKLLYILTEHPDQVLSRERLFYLLKGREYELFDRSIDILISKLRKIIEPDPSHPIHIQTIWGEGYLFVPDPD